MTSPRRRFAIAVASAVLLLAGVSYAKQAKDAILETTRHKAATDPEVYIPLREEMTRMEIRFVELQIMASEDKVDFQAVRRALEGMETSVRKIRKVNPNDALREPLKQLSRQIDGLQMRKNPEALRDGLDRLFQTCFKCHQVHAPLM